MQVAGGKAITYRSSLISQPVNGILLQIVGPPYVVQNRTPYKLTQFSLRDHIDALYNLDM
jgi:hypothetical protein